MLRVATSHAPCDTLCSVMITQVIRMTCNRFKMQILFALCDDTQVMSYVPTYVLLLLLLLLLQAVVPLAHPTMIYM
jgi:hypothetical protein